MFKISSGFRIAVFAFIVCLFALSATAEQYGDFTYTDYGAEIIIDSYTGAGGAVTIPGTIDGKPVTSIGSYAFFFCTSLSSIKIPASVTSIEEAAFAFCSNLSGVTISNNITSIGDNAFVICSKLTSVTIPASVTSIGYTAFSHCSSLNAINVSPLNPYYSSTAGVLFNKSKDTLIQCPGGKTGSYIIPDSVTTIGYQAFGFCSKLSSVMVSDKVSVVLGVLGVKPGVLKRSHFFEIIREILHRKII